MSKINAINNESEELTIDPGASGDSFVQFDINGTGEFRIGVDDDDSDKFKISQGSALGSNDTFIITAAGEITKPLQPAFLAKRDSTLSNVTGDGTNYPTVVFDNEIFDQNGDYDNSTGIFTAPITGRYLFTVGFYLTDFTSSHTRCVTYMSSSNGVYYTFDCNAANVKNVSNEIRICNSCVADMDASDTITAGLNVQNGTKVVDIFGDGTTTRFSYFGGYLIC